MIAAAGNRYRVITIPAINCCIITISDFDCIIIVTTINRMIASVRNSYKVIAALTINLMFISFGYGNCIRAVASFKGMIIAFAYSNCIIPAVKRHVVFKTTGNRDLFLSGTAAFNINFIACSFQYRNFVISAFVFYFMLITCINRYSVVIGAGINFL